MEKKLQLKVFVPQGAFGASQYDTALDKMLREIALAVSVDPREWAEKYGTNFENETFMMKTFCWCEREDCPWCAGCCCPSSAFHYFIDDGEVGFQEWLDFYERNVPPTSDPDWQKVSREINKRRTESHDLVCDFCQGKGIATLKGGEAGRAAPNFWHKPTDFKVWWYKYIGRDVESNRSLQRGELVKIKKSCLHSLVNMYSEK